LILTAFGIMSAIGGRLSGKLANKLGKRKVLSSGLLSAAIADIIIFSFGDSIYLLVLGVALLGLGFIFTHSTLLTRATEFAQIEFILLFFIGKTFIQNKTYPTVRQVFILI